MDVADAITGKTAKKQYALAAEAQAEQRRRVAEEEARVAAVEAGQRRILNGGGGGLLSFIDQPANEDSTVPKLKKQLGGERA